mmetsp:Transcript_4095/g.8256  ORF Transcript_4095/g.8256 Transcript_4095/m.8256 type:complete len:100 (+) Transcript_4095:641-940(+)
MHSSIYGKRDYTPFGQPINNDETTATEIKTNQFSRLLNESTLFRNKAMQMICVVLLLRHRYKALAVVYLSSKHVYALSIFKVRGRPIVSLSSCQQPPFR